MKLISHLLLILIVFSFSINVYAEENRAKELAGVIKKYIEDSVPLTQQYPLYSEIRTRISDVITTIDSSKTETRQLLKDLAFYHNNNIQDIVKMIATREGGTERFKIWKQESIDNLINNENLKKLSLKSQKI